MKWHLLLCVRESLWPIPHQIFKKTTKPAENFFFNFCGTKKLQIPLVYIDYQKFGPKFQIPPYFPKNDPKKKRQKSYNKWWFEIFRVFYHFFYRFWVKLPLIIKNFAFFFGRFCNNKARFEFWVKNFGKLCIYIVYQNFLSKVEFYS